MTINSTHLKPLTVLAPPMLCEAIGYQGKARFVAFYWTPAGDEVIYTDGRISADGCWIAWLLFTQHHAIAPHLEPYNFGSSDEEAIHWLMINRESHQMYVGTRQAVYQFLIEQFAEQSRYDELLNNESVKKISFEDMRSFLLQAFAEMPTPSNEEIMEDMRKQNARTEELRVWLDGKPL